MINPKIYKMLMQQHIDIPHPSWWIVISYDYKYFISEYEVNK